MLINYNFITFIDLLNPLCLSSDSLETNTDLCTIYNIRSYNFKLAFINSLTNDQVDYRNGLFCIVIKLLIM